MSKGEPCEQVDHFEDNEVVSLGFEEIVQLHDVRTAGSKTRGHHGHRPNRTETVKRHSKRTVPTHTRATPTADARQQRDARVLVDEAHGDNFASDGLFVLGAHLVLLDDFDGHREVGVTVVARLHRTHARARRS